MLILYFPLLALISLVGYYTTPSEVTSFIQSHIFTLDVLSYLTIGAARKHFYRNNELQAVEIPSTTLEVTYPAENNLQTQAILIALSTFLILSALLYGIRANLIAAARQNAPTDSFDVLFGSSASVTLYILDGLPSLPVDVDMIEDQVYDDDYQTADENEDSEDQEDEVDYAPKLLLEGFMPAESDSLALVLWHSGPMMEAVDGEIKAPKPKKKKCRRGKRSSANSKFRRWLQERDELTENMDAADEQIGSSPPIPTHSSNIFVDIAEVIDEPSRCPRPRTPPRTEHACPSWPPRAPSPSMLPKLYPSSSTMSDQQCAGGSEEPRAPPPLSPATEPTSPQNWRIRRIRPTITDGGVRMLRHWLGVARRVAPKSMTPSASASDPQASKTSQPLETPPSNINPVKGGDMDTTLVNTTFIDETIEDFDKGFSKSVDNIETRKHTTSPAIYKGSRRFSEAQTSGTTEDRKPYLARRDTRKGLGLDDDIVVWNPRG